VHFDAKKGKESFQSMLKKAYGDKIADFSIGVNYRMVTKLFEVW
jgi:hypothetical protein